MESTPVLGYVITALVAIMTLLQVFYLFQQSASNKKQDKTNDLLRDVTDRIIVLETEHNLMKKNCKHHIPE